MSWVWFWRKISRRVPDIFREVGSDVKTKVGERVEAWVLQLKHHSLSIHVSDEEQTEWEGLYSCNSQKNKRGQNQWLSCNICRQLYIWKWEPVKLLYVQRVGASEVAVCSESGSQWSCCMRDVQCWWHSALRIRHAVEFWNFCFGLITELGVPMRREFQ